MHLTHCDSDCDSDDDWQRLDSESYPKSDRSGSDSDSESDMLN
jgi:hypothetical protein